jgi:hypothetical protein
LEADHDSTVRRIKECESENHDLKSELERMKKLHDSDEFRIIEKDKLLKAAETKARELSVSQERLGTELASLKDANEKDRQAARQAVINAKWVILIIGTFVKGQAN